MHSWSQEDYSHQDLAAAARKHPRGPTNSRDFRVTISSCSPFVVVMKAAHFWQGYHRAQLRHVNGSWLWCILAQGQMCATFVAVAKIGSKNPAERVFVGHNDIIEALTTD